MNQKIKMAQKLASKTRIFLDSKRLLGVMVDVVKNFPKSQRYIVGDKLENLLIENLHLIARAYMMKNLAERINHLSRLQSNLEVIDTLIELAGQKRWIQGEGQLASILQLKDNIGRQATAWKGSLVEVYQKAHQTVPPMIGGNNIQR